MTEQLNFSIQIQANDTAIWNALWSDSNYRTWAAIFFEGSFVMAKDEWKENSHVLFLGPNQNGIYSLIETHIPNQIIGFKHLGNVVNGEEQDPTDETKKWSDAREIYNIDVDEKGNTFLKVKIDVLNEHVDFMKEKFPIALEVIKKTAEAKL